MGSVAGPNCSSNFGSFIIESLGYNLVGSSVGCTFAATTGDLTGFDPRLGQLEGSPGYLPLLPSSPAIDAGNPAGCEGSSGPLTTDQRGFPRLGICDIGAYEMQAIGFSTKTINRGIALPGQAVTYDIELENGGDTDLTTVRVTDSVPISLTYQPGSLSASSGSYGYSNGVITWTGSILAGGAEALTYGATINQGVPLRSSISNQATISGGGETVYRSAGLDVNYNYVYLPCISTGCPSFFDDFSDPTSGWDVVDDAFVRSEYLNGEYRILTKQAGYFYLFRAPTCDRQNYEVEVDARWVGTPGSSYGLIFGITSGYEEFYLYDMNTDYRQFRLFRADPGGLTVLVPPTYSAAIQGGTASNHLKVIRNGDQITLAVNGTVLGTWSDGTIGGGTGAGLVTNPYQDSPTSDARFDNFSIITLPGNGALAQEPSGLMAKERELAAPDARRLPAPVDMGW
jgi:uncharacterized repeat protein (TIGR01451 family)